MNSLQFRLTLWFVFLSLLLYAAGGGLAWVLFESGLSGSLEDELNSLAAEIRPAVEYVDGNPTLRRWATRAHEEPMLVTLQLFDSHGGLLEHYGPIGVQHLISGTAQRDPSNASTRVRSKNYGLAIGHRLKGFLQVQVSTKHHDDALRQFELTFLFMAPFLALALGIAGYIYSGKAVQPVQSTLDMLRRFVADAGHEFNTPITIIEASLQTLEATLHESGIPTDVLDMIARASTRMKELASNLVLLARIESPDVVLPKSPMSVRELLQSTVEQFTPLAAARQISLVSGAIPNVVIIANVDSMRIMMDNLLQNALRYTEPGGSVSISASGDDNEVTLIVEDTGIGIDAESLKHIFERFYRADKSRSRAAGGSGLGLSIVKAIVETHRGNIVADSEPGKGSKFVVRMPCRAADVAVKLEALGNH